MVYSGSARGEGRPRINRYVTFLRGINVGGKTVKMDVLRAAIEKAGYENVRTLLASGNVVLDSKLKSVQAVRTEIEGVLSKTFGFEVHVIARTAREIEDLQTAELFRGVKVNPATRLYITFLSEKPKSKLKVPFASLDGDYKILAVLEGHVVSVLTLTPQSGTVDAMAILEKEFGKEITTRNWNTLLKLKPLLTQS